MELFTDILRVIVAISSTYMSLSPTTAVYKIHKHKQVGQASIAPLASLWVCSHMWMTYGYVTDAYFPLFTTNAVGNVFSIFFLVIYYRYTTEKRTAKYYCSAALMCVLLATAFGVLGKSLLLGTTVEFVGSTLGYVSIASSLIMYASPFAQMSEVLKSKSSESIPILMCMVGTVNNALWAIYGLLVDDLMLVVPGTVNLSLGIIQVALYILYHPRIQAARNGFQNFNTVTLEAINSVSGEALEAVNPLKQGELLVSMIAPSIIVPVETESTTNKMSIECPAVAFDNSGLDILQTSDATVTAVA